MNNTFKIYALIDFDNSIKYIGITSKDLNKRLNQHIYSSLNKIGSLTKKESWIKNRFENNKNIDIVLLEDDLTKEDALELEISYISYYGISNLTNSTLGGEGTFGYKYSPEQLVNWYNLKPINEYDLDGNFIKNFSSITKAAEHYGFSHSSVAYCVSNKNITSHNKIFVMEDDLFLDDKLRKIKMKQYKLYDIDGNLIDVSKSLNKLYKKYNLTQRVNDFSKRLWNGLNPSVIKTKYLITTPNTDIDVLLNKIKIYHLYKSNGEYIKSFSNVNQIAKYLKCSYTGVTECIRGRLKTIKGYVILKHDNSFIEPMYNNRKKINVYKNGKLIHTFDTIKDASVFFNIDASGITKCCRGKRKSIKGYDFRYINDIV